MPNTSRVEARVFEGIRDALSPHGVACEITERKGGSIGIRMSKDDGRRTIYVSARQNPAADRARLNSISDAKRICREAGWIAERPVRVGEVGVALKEALKSSTMIQTQMRCDVIEEPPPAPKAIQPGYSGVATTAAANKKEEPVPEPTSIKAVPPAQDRIVTGRLAIYGAHDGKKPYFQVAMPAADVLPEWRDHYYEPVVRRGEIIVRQSTKGSRRWTSYNGDRWQAIAFNLDDRDPVLFDGEFGMTDCLITITPDGLFSIDVPPKDKRSQRQQRGAETQLPAEAATDPLAVLKQAKDTINAMRKKVPGLVIKLEENGDIKFTVEI